jgi:uncharacterized protein (TIGR02246 family)
MKAVFLSAALLALVGAVPAQNAPDDKSPEMDAVIANDRAYEAAFEKGDVKALAAFFAQDAEYTTDDGQTFRGLPAIEDSIRAASGENRGAKLAITADTVRVLTPEVVVEKGSTSVTAKDGEISGALYTAIHVKKDGKWKISQLVETPLPEVTPHDRLSELAWLIGNWEDSDKSTDLTVKSEYVWAKGGNFITRNVSVKRGAESVLDGWQIIGWDPVEERFHSWTFDGEGGFAEAFWTREGERWLMRESGVNPSGGRITSENTLTKLGEDKLAWESHNRTLDGEPQPAIGRIEIVRVKGK